MQNSFNSAKTFILNNKTTAICLAAFILLFSFSIVHKIFLVNNYWLNIDEIYTLSHVNDFTIDSRSPGYDIDRTRPVPAIKIYRQSTDRLGFKERIKNIQILLKRWHQIDVHPPITTLLIKTFTPGERNYLTLRWWALSMFAIILVAYYLLFRELGFKRLESLIALIIFSSSSLGCLWSIFPRPHSPAAILLCLALIVLNRQQKTPKLNISTVSIFIALAYLCFMTSYIAWLNLIIITSFSTIYNYIQTKNLKRLSTNLFQILILVSFYLLHYQQIKVQQTIFKQYYGHYGWEELTKALEHLYTFVTFNLPNQYAWLVFLLIIVFSTIYYKKIFYSKKNIQIFLIALVPCISIIIIDFYTDKNLILQIRYLLFALPFLSLLLTRIFINNLVIFTLIFVPLIYTSSHNWDLHKHMTIDYFIKQKFHKKILELEQTRNINRDPVLILLSDFNPLSIFFVHRYVTRALRVKELKGPNLNDPETVNFLNNVYMIDPYIEKIDKVIIEKNIRRVINTDSHLEIQVAPSYRKDMVVI